MATLIKTAEDIKKYVSTAFNFTFDIVKPYVVKSERQKIKNLIGEATYSAWTETAPTEGNPLKAYELFREASANLSVLHYIPIGVVTVADHGITVSTSAHTATASYGQILDLKRSLIEIANSALDEALELMEANKTDFPLWTPTESYTVFKELMVQTTSEFNRFFNIQNSRLTFIALRAYQLEVQQQIFDWLDADTFFQIKEAEGAFAATLAANLATSLVVISKSKEAKELAQRAQVNYTVSQAAESGVFLFKSTGMFTKYAEIPTEKHHQLSDYQLKRLIDSRNSAAEDAMKRLKKLVLDNLDVFTNYTPPTDAAIDPIIGGKSIVSF